MTSSEMLRQVLLQMEFAIKLLNYIELKKINKAGFDINTTVQLERKNLHFPDNTFNTYDDIILAAQNNYLMTFAAISIVIEDCLQDAGIQI